MPSLKSNVRDGVNISLDDICNLITVETELDELGQPVGTNEVSRQVFCSRKSVSRAEYAAAGQNGLKPDLVLVVDSDEYDDEDTVSYGDKKLHVYRTYLRQDGFTELYCEVVSGVH